METNNPLTSSPSHRLETPLSPLQPFIRIPAGLPSWLLLLLLLVLPRVLKEMGSPAVGVSGGGSLVLLGLSLGFSPG